ncbi:MAG: ankyrin repeat domain-containing protein [Vulcanimicrobiota bacterium]
MKKKKVFELIREGNSKKIKMLVEDNPDLVDVRNKHGETPLHWAAYRGERKIAKILIENDADVNCRDHYGDSPLHLAEKRGHKAIARRLRKVGATV